MNIAVIPARVGSKRIPLKNIKDFCGKPMIAWSIEEAKKSNIFDKIIVSTDDSEIKEIAENYGAEVPFIRPAPLADDHTGTIEVVAHAVKWMLDQQWSLFNICCIYPASPFIFSKDLQIGFKKIQLKKWSYSFVVTDFGSPIFRSFKIIENNQIEMLYPENFNIRSQDLPNIFHDAGQFYWGKVDSWLEKKIFFAAHSFPIIIPRWRVQDIDTFDDWDRAVILKKSFSI